MHKVLIYGAGGHCKLTIDLLQKLGYHVVGILDDDPKLHNSLCFGHRIIGGFDLLKNDDYRDCKIVIGVAKPDIRRKIFEKISSVGYEFITVIHHSAYIGEYVDLGPAVMIMGHAVVNTGAKLGKGVVINTGAIVEHDCIVHDFVHIAPGAHLAGAVEVGSGTFIGIGATIIEFIKIGENAVIGAGAVVIDDVPAGSIVVGNPAKVVRRIQ
jgi:sugar O-acyltransferase (sialic acid O-acetyltransferase NeuD family)